MTYKYNNSDEYCLYLSLEDRKTALSGQSSGVESIIQAAKALISLSSSTSASLESTMEANLEQSVFDTAIDGYVKDFNAMFANGNPAYDEALEFLTILCTEKVSGEILFGFLQDSTVQKNLAILGTQKGTLPTAQTADKQANEQLTAQKVGDAMAAKINTYVEETYTIMGDKERIEKQKALNATISFLDLAFGGINVKYNKNQGWLFVGGATTELVVQTGLYVWSKYAANSIVEKSTTKVLKKAAEDTAEKAITTKAAKEIAENAATNAAMEYCTAFNKYNSLYTTFDNDVEEALRKCLYDILKEDNYNSIRQVLREMDDNTLKSILENKSFSNKDPQMWRNLFNDNKNLDLFLKNIDIDDIDDLFSNEKYANDLACIKNELEKEYNKLQEKLDKAKAFADEKYKAYNEAQANKQAKEVAAKKAQKAKNKSENVYKTASDLKTAKAEAKTAAKEYRQAQKNFKNSFDVDNLIKNSKLDKVTDKDLIEKLRKLKKGDKTVTFTAEELDKMDKILAIDKKSLKVKYDELKKISDKADDAADVLEKAKNLRQTAKGGIVDTLNNDVKINRHGGKTTSVKNKSWFNKADDVADAIAKNVNLDLDGKGVKRVKLMDTLTDGVEKVADETLEASSKKIVNNTGKNASKTATATKAFRLGGVLSKAFMAVDCVSAAIDGGMMGYGIAALAVEKNAKNFVKADGSYDTTRASWVKGLGAASGACLGFVAGMWTGGAGAAMNAATGGILGTTVSVVVGGVGALLGLASVALCFKWFG